MNSILKVFLFCCGFAFFFTVIYLLLKKKISEWNSIAWLSGALAILIVSANPELVDWIAAKLGVSYPPSLIFLFSTLVLLLIVLYQSMQISELQKKMRQLAQNVAVHRQLEQSEKREQTESNDPNLPL